MSRITTHVLDAMLGKPAAGIEIRLDAAQGDAWNKIAIGATDADGRCRELIQDAAAGIYRLTFLTGPYLENKGRSTIYPEISITFRCDGREHYHLPLLLSDNSYTTYRGS
ncbi:MAG TPA: hydroxyisourate hydrolase [Terracidiphilus sp.]|jgi:5-hydroxyisourate hydrolase|nr:hydroxyisourate hydrolase [Terracidiphilus sp.]